MTRERQIQDLIEERARDLQAMIKQLGDFRTEPGVGYSPVDLPPNLRAVSARDVEWLVAGGASATTALRVRKVGQIGLPRSTLTAPFTFEKLSVSYMTRYFLMHHSHFPRLAICVAYGAGESRLVPQVISAAF